MTRPVVRMRAGAAGRVARGSPWAYANELLMAEAKQLAPGSLVDLANHDGRPLGTAFFNAHSLIAGRLVSRQAGIAIDADFLAERIARALAIRERLFDRPFYRLVHAEADGLPGLIVDRFDAVLSVQLNTAGMDRLRSDVLAALESVLAPAAVILRNESPARSLEGLGQETAVLKGTLDGPLELEENGRRFFADLAGGQKTGWFYDHRPNRAFAARLAKDAQVLDLYAYAGGFGVTAAAAGAAGVTLVDRAEPALALARRAAEANGVADRCRFVAEEAFAHLEGLAAAGERFGLVLADPPAFVKSKKALKSGLKGYRKLARLAASVTAEEGHLMVASCSHNVGLDQLTAEIAAGLAAAGRSGRILRTSGAGPDHPVHPHLPETAYLKAVFLALD